MPQEKFRFRVTDGWLRDVASEPTPGQKWPCIRWDDQLLSDQKRFIDVQAALAVEYNLNWGYFVNRNWPVPFKNVIDADRDRRLRTFVEEAHSRGVKVLSGMGVYSWGFDEVVAKVPATSCGKPNSHGYVVMCAASDAAWEWQRRVLDFHMDSKWGLDGISMQSADNGRCECDACSKLTPAQYHARILIRTADYVRRQRPDWTIGQACWGLEVDDPGQWDDLVEISRHVDYMVEVAENTMRKGLRRELVARLKCAFGSVGGPFVEPPQHWSRARWFLPTGLSSARALKKLWDDGGRACEYFFRIFANPSDEVSWRSGARILSSPETSPAESLKEAVAAVYGVTGSPADDLAAWYERAEEAYFSRADFAQGDADLSLEPLIWHEKPAEAGPAVYLSTRMTSAARSDYAADLRRLKVEIAAMKPMRENVKRRTITCIDGALADIAAIQ